MDKMTEIPHIDESYPDDMPDGRWIDRDGWEVCIKDGKWHRTDGPAVIYPNGTVFWCLDGYAYTFGVWLEKTTGITDKQKVLLKLKYG